MTPALMQRNPYRGNPERAWVRVQIRDGSGNVRDLDLLVLDALQWKRHVTHFSVEEAIEAARRIGAKQTLFTHIAHALGHEETNRSLPGGMKLAFDGQRVEARGS